MDYHISSGKTSTGITLDDYDKMHVSSGGTANNTTIISSFMYVSLGGNANGTTVKNNGCMSI